jgi:large subunit ribosomal protein L15
MWFEGGQMPLTRRVPKFGFTPRNRIEVQVVNIETLELLVEQKKLTGGIVTPDVLYKIGTIEKKNVPVKILGDGDLKVKLDVTAHAFSKSALTKIETAGGKATILTKTTVKS